MAGSEQSAPALHAAHWPALHTCAPASPPVVAPQGVPSLAAVVSWHPRPASAQTHVPFWQSFGEHAPPPRHEGGVTTWVVSGAPAASVAWLSTAASPV